MWLVIRKENLARWSVPSPASKYEDCNLRRLAEDRLSWKRIREDKRKIKGKDIEQRRYAQDHFMNKTMND
jgi:hypothetical protein